MPDLDRNDPQFLAAVQEEVARAKSTWDAEVVGLKAKNAELLTELKPYKGLGPVADLQRQLEEIDVLRTKAAAAEGDPAKIDALVEHRATLKFETAKKELQGVIDQATATAENEAKKAADLEANLRRTRLELVLAQATAGKPNVINPVAYDVLVQNLDKIVQFVDVQGVGTVPRFKIADTWVPGDGPDKLLTPDRWVDLTLTGKGPTPDLAFCFLNTASGGGTQRSGDPGGKTWREMSEQERARLSIDDPAKARELMGLPGKS